VINRAFAEDLQDLIAKFKKFQLENDTPYAYDLLGFSEWLEFEKEIK
jgi:hypothetical protein